MLGLPQNTLPAVVIASNVSVIQGIKPDGTPVIVLLIQDGTGDKVAHLDLEHAKLVGEALLKGAQAGRLTLAGPSPFRRPGFPTAS